MMFEERVSKILEIVNERHTASVADLAALLGTSESTIRRDITELDKPGTVKARTWRCRKTVQFRNHSRV